MAARKTTAKAAAKQPEAKTQDTQQSAAQAAQPSQPGTGAEAQSSGAGEGSAKASGQPSKERGPAKDGTSSGVELEVVTRLERRIRAGVVVTRDPRTVTVTEDVAEALEADPHITVRRA